MSSLRTSKGASHHHEDDVGGDDGELEIDADTATAAQQMQLFRATPMHLAFDNVSFDVDAPSWLLYDEDSSATAHQRAF